MDSFRRNEREHNNDSASSSRITLPISFSSIPTRSIPIIPPAHENTMLTWDGDELFGPEPLVLAQTGSTSQARPPSPSLSPVTLPRPLSSAESPPEYSQVQKPTTNVRYSFSPVGSNAMVLLPPSDAQDTRPQYYITVSMNCFMPLAHITSIYWGTNEQGSPVAEFEMGIIAASNRLRIGDRTEAISSCLSKVEGTRTHAIWEWIIPRPPGRGPVKIAWNFIRRPCICTLYPSKTVILAKFSPQIGVNVQKYLSQLEVTPEGQDYLDHIVLSALIIERRRLTPGRDAVLKTLFNNN